MGGALSAGVLILVLSGALACAGQQPAGPSLRVHDPEPSGSETVPPQRLSGDMPDLAGLFGRGVKRAPCVLMATVTSRGDLADFEWESAEEVDPRFRAEIERVMATWKFRPATFQGHPVSVPNRFEFDSCPLVGPT
jgi:hypothetical protein